MQQGHRTIAIFCNNISKEMDEESIEYQNYSTW